MAGGVEGPVTRLGDLSASRLSTVTRGGPSPQISKKTNRMWEDYRNHRNRSRFINIFVTELLLNPYHNIAWPFSFLSNKKQAFWENENCVWDCHFLSKAVAWLAPTCERRRNETLFHVVPSWFCIFSQRSVFYSCLLSLLIDYRSVTMPNSFGSLFNVINAYMTPIHVYCSALC